MRLRSKASSATDRRYTGRPEDERLPFGQLLVYGTQHILTMYGGVIAPPLIVRGAARPSRSPPPAADGGRRPGPPGPRPAPPGHRRVVHRRPGHGAAAPRARPVRRPAAD